MSTREFTAILGQSEGWWIGWAEQVPGVNCQERTKEKLLETLRVTLREALEDAPLGDDAAVGAGYERVRLYV